MPAAIRKTRPVPTSKKATRLMHKDESLILLAVTGMSPAVLTETVWALSKEQLSSVPDRVIAITTPRGKECIRRELLTPLAHGEDSLWQLLRSEILGPSYTNSRKLNLDINVISAPNPTAGCSEPIEDFRNEAENAAMADFLLAQVRALVETPGVRLIASIAGGRKTLSALCYACMSLLGRETDRLTHVLVNEPFDSPELSPRFYFPEQPVQQLELDGKKHIARQAKIDLGDLPFVPLRNLFERDIIKRPCSFTELVERCKKEVGNAARRNVRLTVWRSRKEIEVNGIKIPTSAMQQVLMLFLADPATSPARDKIVYYKDAITPLREYAATLYAQKESGADWRSSAVVPTSFTPENVVKLLNELKDRLEKAGPDAVPLDPLLPTKGRFSIDLSPSAITIRD